VELYFDSSMCLHGMHRINFAFACTFILQVSLTISSSVKIHGMIHLTRYSGPVSYSGQTTFGVYRSSGSWTA
jgi:hypothetical protein